MHTRILAEFVASMASAELPEQTAEQAKMCVADLLGVAIAGSVQPEAGIWRTYFQGAGESGGAGASLWDGGFGRLGYRQAAMLNGAYGHLLDMDDVHNASITHLGTVTIPAAMAVGQKQRRSGREVLAAVTAGYEAGARLGQVITPGSYHYWHTTGVVGALASAASAGVLLRLTPGQMNHCFGSAGTQAAGLWEFLADGAMSKSLHTANGVICGIRSAELAELGFTGAGSILEGERGLVRALASDHSMEALTHGLGDSFEIQRNSFKPYPCCRHIHSAIWAAKKLLEKASVRAGEIIAVRDRTYRLAESTTNSPSPATAYAHKFSAQYCIARMLLDGKLEIRDFTGQRTAEPEVRALMARVTVSEDPAMEGVYRRDPGKWPHLLEVAMKDGTVNAQYVEYPLGDYQNPLSWEGLEEKFMAITRGILSGDAARRLLDRVRELERLEDVNGLFLPAGRQHVVPGPEKASAV